MELGAVLKKWGKKIMPSAVAIFLTLTFFVTLNRALAAEPDPLNPADPAFVRAASVNQTVEAEDVAGLAKWEQSNLVTSGLKFMVRGKEALAWTLAIDNAGFDNPAIQTSYSKVLTVVNSLFILGLLAIAVMWIFSIFIPRNYLKRVILFYAIGVVFVNFALPLNRLLIDGTNLLQKTFLAQEENPIGIVDIVSAPLYNQANGYEENSDLTTVKQAHKISVSLDGAEGVPINVGTIAPEDPKPVSAQGTLGGLAGGSIELQFQPAGPQALNLKPNRPFTASLQTEKAFDPNREQAVFSFVLMLLTGFAYLLIALIFLMRLVILWALLILSPLLFLLAIFNVTRGYFYNWLSLYGRWLLIGPLMALGLTVIVNIWQAVGLPITSSYTAEAAAGFGKFSNIRFYLPGSNVPNDLSTTGQMMDYILFLMMLYLPIFFGFALTRHKTWQSTLEAVTAVAPRAFERRINGNTVKTESGKSETASEKVPRTGLVTGIKGFFGAQLGRFSKAEPPSVLNIRSNKSESSIPGAVNFLPEQMSLMPMPELMGLLGAHSESRHSREQVIGKLANPGLISDPAERRHVESVRKEVEVRAARGEAEAVVLQNEIAAQSTGVAPVLVSNPVHVEVNAASTAMPTLGLSEVVRPQEKKTDSSSAVTQPLGGNKAADEKAEAEKDEKTEETADEKEAEENNDAEKTDDLNPPTQL